MAHSSPRGSLKREPYLILARDSVVSESALRDSTMPVQKHRYKKTPNKYAHCPDGTTVIFMRRRTGQTFECLIDTEDFELVRAYRWSVALGKHSAYAVTTTDAGKRLNISTLVCPGCELVLYRNHNGLDNRARDQLRPPLHLLRSILVALADLAVREGRSARRGAS